MRVTQAGLDVGRLTPWKLPLCAVFLALFLCLSPALADDVTEDLPALAEIDSLDNSDATIRRFFLTSQGMRGQTVPIPETEGWFCTLSQATHVMLDFWPNLNQWVFQVGFSEEAELTAGGLATCHRLAGEMEQR
ncbi:MAG: hypothetical protein GKS03_02955 [Alphaproteobacteria bacterium]|nr:hypothetical protein [Alphaproteobacteria bacterium]